MEPPQKEQSISFEEEDFLKGLRIERVLGKGGWNVVYLLQDGRVLRASLLSDNDESGIQSVTRGDQIAYLLDRDRKIYGPSVPRLFQTLFQVKQVPESLGFDATNSSSESYWMEIMEYLPIDAKKYTLANEDEWWFFAFSLLWFFYTAQAELGFIHQDFKLANMMIRKLEKPTTMAFSLGSKKKFVFPNVLHVPVVIDFDLGVSVGITKKENMDFFGTTTWRPPETLSDSPYIWGYDFFVVGHILLCYATRWNLLDRNFYDRSEYITRIMKHFSGERHHFQTLLTTAALNLYFHGNLVPKRRWKVVEEEDYDLYFKPGKTMRLFEQEARYILSLYGDRLDDLKPDQKILIGKLIHWNPRERDMAGRPYEHFDMFSSQETLTAAPENTFSYMFASPQYEDKNRQRKYGSFKALECTVCGDEHEYAKCGGCIGRPEGPTYCSTRCANRDWFIKGHHKECSSI